MTQGRQVDPGFDRLPGEVVDWLMQPFASFLRIEAAAGAILLAVTIAALVLSNSPSWAAKPTATKRTKSPSIARLRGGNPCALLSA